MEIIEEAGSDLHQRAASVSVSNTSRRRSVLTMEGTENCFYSLFSCFLQARKGEEKPGDSVHHQWCNDLHCVGGNSGHGNFSFFSDN